ncbi:MAG: trigger factor [Bifidobacteriaceae bacterium]|nr:trigger factor [Bifidobacteriaceae bacterium]
MKSVVASLGPTKAKLTVEVEAEDLKTAMDKAYKQIAGQVTIPGFRRGKAPKRVIDQRFGRGAVIAQALDDGLPGWFRAALEQSGLSPLAQPAIEFTRDPDPAAPEPDCEFTATMEVAPEIAIPDLSKVTVTVDAAEPTEAEVDQAVEDLRQRFSSLKVVDRPARAGDFVTIDLKAEVDDDEIDSVSGVSHQVGSGNLVDGLDEALEGLSAGEVTTFESILAGGPMAGEDALVTVKAVAVKERELPEVDDEWVELASSFDTVAELRDSLRGEIAQAKGRGQVFQAQDRLIRHLLATLDFPAPEGVLEAEVGKILAAKAKAPAPPPAPRPADAADAAEAADPAQGAEAEATLAIRSQLLLDALAAHLKVTATNGELMQFMVSFAQRHGIDPEAFVKTAAENGEVTHFYAELIRNKAALVAASQVQVEDANGAPVDLKSRLRLPDAAAGAEAAAAGDALQDAEAAEEALVEEVDIDLDSLLGEVGEEAWEEAEEA